MIVMPCSLMKFILFNHFNLIIDFLVTSHFNQGLFDIVRLN
jgi:hypothetical protein